MKNSSNKKQFIFFTIFFLSFLFLKNNGIMVPIDMKKKYQETWGPLITPHQKSVFFSAGAGYLLQKLLSLGIKKYNNKKQFNSLFAENNDNRLFTDSFENTVTLKSNNNINITIKYSLPIEIEGNNIRRIYFFIGGKNKYNLKITINKKDYYSYKFNLEKNTVTFKRVNEEEMIREEEKEEERKLVIQGNTLYAIKLNELEEEALAEIYIGKKYNEDFTEAEGDLNEKLTVTSNKYLISNIVNQIGRDIKETYQYFSKDMRRLIPAIAVALPVWYFSRLNFAEYQYKKDSEEFEKNTERLLNAKYQITTPPKKDKTDIDKQKEKIRKYLEKQVKEKTKETMQEPYFKSIIETGRDYFGTEKSPDDISDYQYATNNPTNKRYFNNLVFQKIKNDIKKNKQPNDDLYFLFEEKYPIEKINANLE